MLPDTLLNPFELYELPFGDWVTAAVDFLVDNYRPFFQAIRQPISWLLDAIETVLLSVPPLFFLILVGLLIWQLASRKVAIFSLCALTFIGFLGIWNPAMVTLALVLAALVLCLAIGIPLGIACAQNERLERSIQPVLDTMQTLPVFVYLIPVVMLFGIGNVPGVLATVVFAIPPLIRLTNLGIRQVSSDTVEASRAFGATPKQVLWHVQLPLARPTILTGVNQAILLALSMSVVASMISAGGLGRIVLQGLGQVNSGKATVGGVGIVLLAMTLDRITQSAAQGNTLTWKERGPIGWLRSRWTPQKFIGLTAAALLIGLPIFIDNLLNPFDLYTLPLADWVNVAIDFLVKSFNQIFQAILQPISWLLDAIGTVLLSVPPLVFLILLSLSIWQLASRKVVIFSLCALTFIGFLGLWDEAMVTLALVLAALVLFLAIGIPLGIACAQNERLERSIQPVLDTMQTLPVFVYLVPVLMLFGIGNVPGVLATVVFAIPPLIRLTNLGIRQVSSDTVEASRAFGATPKQVLWDVQLPLARPTILTGVNQAILLALSMAVVASIIGVGGSGQIVWEGLGRLNPGRASEGGVSIVLLAMALDRITQVTSQTNSIPWQERGPIGLLRSRWSAQKFVGVTVMTLLVGVAIAGLVTTQLSPQTASQGKRVRSGYTPLKEEQFQTEIVNLGLEALGYQIDPPKQLEALTLHLAVGRGDLDYTSIYWEKNQQPFFERSGGNRTLDVVGVLVPDLVQGYQIDKKTADQYNITHIDQLKDPELAKLFDSDGDGKANLVGCNSGWQCEFRIAHQIKTYGLEDTVEQMQGSYSILIADTLTRYRQGEPILYYTWTPYWMASVLKPGKDVVWLQVPFTTLLDDQKEATEADTSTNGKNLGFVVDRMRIMANKQFTAANPSARRFFELIEIPLEDISTQNQRLEEGEDSEEDIRRHAQEWIEANQEDFDFWLDEARKAAASNP